MTNIKSYSFSGDADKFSSHIMRIFDSDGNGFLDFKEFLMAIDIATCQTEESKLAWVFKLYDVDNDGFIDIDEMASVMETLESLEFTGPQKSKKRKIQGIIIEFSFLGSNYSSNS